MAPEIRRNGALEEFAAMAKNFSAVSRIPQEFFDGSS
jgi:hypothetical protein